MGLTKCCIVRAHTNQLGDNDAYCI